MMKAYIPRLVEAAQLILIMRGLDAVREPVMRRKAGQSFFMYQSWTMVSLVISFSHRARTSRHIMHCWDCLSSCRNPLS